MGAGLEARVRVRRYRDLYAIPSPVGGWVPRNSVLGRERGNPGISVEQPSDDEDDRAEEIRAVLDSFVDVDGDKVGMGAELETAMEQRASLEGLRRYSVLMRERGLEDDDKSHYPDEVRTAGRETMYLLEHWGEDRERYSGVSARSHVSFLDGEKSEEARDRFVRRVEVMFDGVGREKGGGVGGGREISPMPELPAMTGGGRKRTGAWF